MVTLRRLVKGMNMGDALMISVPSTQLAALKKRIENSEGKVKMGVCL